MKIELVALQCLLGVCIFQANRILPDAYALVVLGLYIALLLQHRAIYGVIIVFLLAYFWSAVYAHWTLKSPLAAADIMQPITVKGCIETIRKQTSLFAGFQFRVHQARLDESTPVEIPGRILLNWYRPEMKLAEGMCLRARVKLKPPHGYASYGVFDRETWAFRNTIGAMGSVQAAYPVEQVDLVSTRASLLRILRNKTYAVFHKVLPDSPQLALLYSLASGDRSLIQAAQWDTFRLTGTSHLMAISGLHVGAVAAACYFCCLCLMRCSARVCQRYAAQRISLFAALLGAGGYALFSGFSLPAQRALIMLALFTLATWLRREAVPTKILAGACILVLILDPRQVLAPGFWLSFSAVLTIIVSLRWSSRKSRVAWFVRLQLILSASAFTLSLYYFGSVSFLSVLANLFAVPAVTFIVLPLLLLSLVFTMVGTCLVFWPILLADMVMQVLWSALEILGQLDWAVVDWHPTLTGVITCHIGLFLLFFAHGFLDRSLLVVFLSSFFLLTSRPLKPAQFNVSVLDVGQGLSVLVQTRHHVLLYDAGPGFFSGYSAGSSVVLPYLRAKNLSHLDAVVISHNDIDHRGGVADVLSRVPTDRLYTSEPSGIYLSPSAPCHSGIQWTWDEVQFEFLHPGNTAVSNRNNRSCVLRVHSAFGSVLLTGDIERLAERELINRAADQIVSDVLLVPHHGSATSSSSGFLQAVRPQIAVNSAGYLNRYRFPRRDIRDRYARYQIPLLNTAELGTIEVLFAASDRKLIVSSYRRRHDRYWNTVYRGHSF